MKKFLLFILLSLPIGPIALSGQNPADPPCSPVRGGKVSYYSEVNRANQSRDQLYEKINRWANKNYGTDVFYSNVSSNKGRGAILVSSKVELLLDETDKTYVKFRLRIQCYDGRYTAELTDIVYQYNPDDDKRIRTYPAEDVIIQEGKGNKVSTIDNPLLFCNATRYFADGILKDIAAATQQRK